MRINGTSAFSTIKFAEGQQSVVPTKIQFLRCGKFNHPQYGKFEITPAILSEMKANFDQDVRGIDVAFDYFHESDKIAAAWVKEFYLEEDGTQLWAEVDWTPTAQRKLAERELRYFSPDFAFEWSDPETGKTFDNVIFGGGLTNRPFVKEMEAIVADETKGENMTDLEKAQKEIKDLKASNLKLSEDMGAKEKELADAKAKAAAAPPAPPAADDTTALKAQLAQLQSENADLKKQCETALAEKNKAAEAAKLAEKEGAFVVLLSEGKACAAQKDAFIKGDMTEFVKLSQPVNLRGSGSSSNPADVKEEEKVASIIKLAEEKKKANPKLSHGDAISLAKKEIEKK